MPMAKHNSLPNPQPGIRAPWAKRCWGSSVVWLTFAWRKLDIVEVLEHEDSWWSTHSATTMHFTLYIYYLYKCIYIYNLYVQSCLDGGFPPSPHGFLFLTPSSWIHILRPPFQAATRDARHGLRTERRQTCKETLKTLQGVNTQAFRENFPSTHWWWASCRYRH